ncbi:dendritic cell-specific transmembrane protein [Neosynchiropus ocellatus]
MHLLLMKKTLADVCGLAVEVFTSDRSDGVKRKVVLLLTCMAMSLLLSCLLLLYLLLSLDYEATAVGAIVGCFGTLLTFALFISKRVRCLCTLFAISVFMKKSRNLLLTAGTSLVVLQNIRNTLENLTGLLRSMICNLRAKKASIMAPITSYIQMLKWLGSILKGVTDLGVFSVDSSLKISPRVEVEGLKERLAEAEQRLNDSVRRVQTLVNAVSSVSSRVFPAVSFLVLLTFIALHMWRYRCDPKYQNRFISQKFVAFDEKQKLEGKLHVLPLSPREEKLYATLPRARPSAREAKAMIRFSLPVISHLSAWVILIGVDSLLYIFVAIVTNRLSEMEPFTVPLVMNIPEIATVVGLPLSETHHRSDFSYSVKLFEEECLPKPKLLLHKSVVPLTAIVLALVLMSLLASKLSQLRLLVCERFFGDAAQRRAEHLHAKILRRRRVKRRVDDKISLRSLLRQPQFWCPLLFPPRADPQSEV